MHGLRIESDWTALIPHFDAKAGPLLLDASIFYETTTIAQDEAECPFQEVGCTALKSPLPAASEAHL